MHYPKCLLKILFLTVILLILLILPHIDFTSLDTMVESIHNEVLTPPFFPYQDKLIFDI